MTINEMICQEMTIRAFFSLFFKTTLSAFFFILSQLLLFLYLSANLALFPPATDINFSAEADFQSILISSCSILMCTGGKQDFIAFAIKLIMHLCRTQNDCNDSFPVVLEGKKASNHFLTLKRGIINYSIVHLRIQGNIWHLYEFCCSEYQLLGQRPLGSCNLLHTLSGLTLSVAVTSCRSVVPWGLWCLI